MSRKKRACSELYYLFNFFKMLNLTSNKCNKHFRILNYIIALIILMVMFMVGRNRIEFMLKSKEKTIHKVLLLFYIASVLIRCFALTFTVTFQRQKIIQLWNGIFKLNNTNHVTYKYVNILVTIIPYLIKSWFGTICALIRNGSNFTAFEWISYALLFLINTFELGMKLKYLTVISLFKNCYNEINVFLITNFKNTSNERVLILRSIAKSLQEVSDLVRLLELILTPLNIALLTESFSFFVGYSYCLIAALYYEENYYNIQETFYIWCDAIFNILVVIIPAAVYSEKVSENNNSKECIFFCLKN